MNGPAVAPGDAVETRPPPGTVRADLSVIIIAAAFAVIVGTLLIGPIPTVRDVEMENPTVYDLTISVRGVDDASWTPLLSVPRGRVESARVLDQGEEWVFVARGQRVDAPQWQVSAAQLEADGWRVVVPESVGATIAAAGGVPSPPSAAAPRP